MQARLSFYFKEIADYLNRVRQPFNANSLALAAGIEAIEDKEHIFNSVKLNKLGLEMIMAKFDDLGFDYINSHGNFISFDSKNDYDKTFEFFIFKNGELVGQFNKLETSANKLRSILEK